MGEVQDILDDETALIQDILVDETALTAMTDKFFKEVDADGNGHIDSKELRALMNRFAKPMKLRDISEEDADKCLADFDADTDGKLSPNEFHQLIQKFLKEVFETRKRETRRFRVVIRPRPLNEREKNQGHEDILHVLRNEYDFERILPVDTDQEQIWEEIKRGTEGVFHGKDILIIPYGQTGCGKTYTIHGDDTSMGVFPRFCEHVFERLKTRNNETWKIEGQCIELYMDQILDLSPDKSVKCKIKMGKDGNSWVENGEWVGCETTSQLLEWSNSCLRRRQVERTMLSQCSSRSHLLYTLRITIGAKTAKICFADLAGSERPQNGDRRMDEEATSINISLVSFLNCCHTLARNEEEQRKYGQKLSFVPFRDSPLTMYLRPFLVGRVTLFANISPSSSCIDETKSTLRAVQRCTGHRMVSKDTDEAAAAV
eukprot:gene19209-934_t